MSPALASIQSFLLLQSLSQLAWPNCSSLRQLLGTEPDDLFWGWAWEGEGGSREKKRCLMFIESSYILVTSYASSPLIPIHGWRKGGSDRPKVTYRVGTEIKCASSLP